MKQNKETLKAYFETGDKPTQQQYSDLVDSYIDAKQPTGEPNRRFIIDENGEVSIASKLNIEQPDWNQIDSTQSDFIKNKPSIFNPKFFLQNNIEGVGNNSTSKISLSQSGNVINSTQGVAIFNFIGESYIAPTNPPIGSIEPNKIFFKVYLESNNTKFSTGWDGSGTVSNSVLLYTYESKNDARNINNVILNEKIPLITEFQSIVPLPSQWIRLSIGELLDNGNKTSSIKHYYLRNLANSSIMKAEDMNVNIKVDLYVEYEDSTNSNATNKSFIARVNSFATTIEK
ncbi:hypothetical protein SAMN04487765_1131 [Tenacibaculum sp. MAR_2010_89]|uniref:hypothetical protein n=1 Tax=Tenacibaculum sp. MAR_2010_89 TaxID=1250198 RepID=UPI00089CFA48|nr:hypothetical protein [Tenacibaculum sp. MAR_2010_89]SEE02178.1 hypothetical protein SAMN04487765_1131 [Tenacibaculum sp. MAR_2010_89]